MESASEHHAKHASGEILRNVSSFCWSILVILAICSVLVYHFQPRSVARILFVDILAMTSLTTFSVGIARSRVLNQETNVADREKPLHSANAVRQTLSMPGGGAESRESLTQCALRDLLGNDKLREVISQTDTLPSMPSLYSGLLRELESPVSSTVKVAEIVRRDIVMTSTILKLTNSAQYGFGSKVSDPVQAVAILGTEATKALPLTIGVFSESVRIGVAKGEMDRLWEHSLAVSRTARKLAELAGADVRTVENSFTAGLLHDMGRLVLISSCPGQWSALKLFSSAQNISMSEAEYEMLGCSHAEIGAYLLNLWNLPTPIVEALAWGILALRPAH